MGMELLPVWFPSSRSMAEHLANIARALCIFMIWGRMLRFPWADPSLAEAEGNPAVSFCWVHSKPTKAAVRDMKWWSVTCRVIYLFYPFAIPFHSLASFRFSGCHCFSWYRVCSCRILSWFSPGSPLWKQKYSSSRASQAVFSHLPQLPSQLGWEKNV